QNRIAEASRMLQKSGFRAFAWEAPHYMASDTDYRAIRKIFPVYYGRLIYFAGAEQGSANRRFFGQFFPYQIARDRYGYQLIPENMGNVVPDPLPGYRKVMPSDLIRHARKLAVVRDGVASFYYHPYLGTSRLQEVVAGVRQAGYEFVSPCSLGFECDGKGVEIPRRDAAVSGSAGRGSGGGALGVLSLLMAILVPLFGERKRYV
ncbi:MAG TPA: DUF2334 domain-containing protein, partial [Gammaproteobacteria bacterium]|nr:DUF2334 domain-containing protein [Gammaproteobacteria bacterium]